MKILISGAGIAGLTTAYWLKRHGFTPTIIERAPALLIGGYKIDVRGAALQVLRRMNIYDAVVATSTDIQKALLVDKKGKIINEMSGDAFGHRIDDDVEIIRGELCRILMEQIADVEFIFGDVIQEITQFSDKVEVKFQKNQPREFDLVIGADGIHSNVRQLVFGDETRFLQELGLYLCVFTLPNYLDLDRVEMQYSEVGKIAAVWSVQGDPNMKACFGFVSESPIDLRDRAMQHLALKRIYKDIDWEVPKFLQMMPEASSDFYFDTAAQIHMDCWSKGRVILVGDAAYCPSPMSGQGTSLALIGSYVLAGELAASQGNFGVAFENYEKQLRSFVKKNQALGLTAAKFMKSKEKNSLLTFFVNKLMQIVPGRIIKFVITLSTRRIKQAANSITLKNY